jgi:TPR repeat protein
LAVLYARGLGVEQNYGLAAEWYLKAADQSDTFSEEIYFADYRSVSGMLVPFHQTVFIDGQLNTDFKLTSVTFNVGLSDSDFTLP